MSRRFLNSRSFGPCLSPASLGSRVASGEPPENADIPMIALLSGRSRASRSRTTAVGPLCPPGNRDSIVNNVTISTPDGHFLMVVRASSESESSNSVFNTPCNPS